MTIKFDKTICLKVDSKIKNMFEDIKKKTELNISEIIRRVFEYLNGNEEIFMKILQVTKPKTKYKVIFNQELRDHFNKNPEELKKIMNDIKIKKAIEKRKFLEAVPDF